MECKNCGVLVAEENAVYCPECGKRLDGKKACPSCGEWIEDKYAYCVYCGARADGKTACKDCGTYFEGAFCPNCGTPAKAQPVKAAPAKAKEKSTPVKVQAVQAEEKPKNPVWETIFSWIRSGAGIACVLFSLIFVFLIGFTATVRGSENALAALGGGSTADPNLFYFFGDVYEELRDFNELDTFKSEIPSVGLLIYAIMGTILSAGTILMVVGFSIPAIIGFIKFATTRVENNGAKWAIRAALAYIGGACALYALNMTAIRMSIVESGVPVSVRASMLMDDATKAGLALVITFLAIYAAGNLVRKGKEWKSGKTIAKYVLTVCAAAFAAIVLAVDKNGLVGLDLSLAGREFKWTIAQHNHNTMVVSMAESVGVEFYNRNLDLITTSFAFSIIQQIMMAATLACAAILLVKGLFSTEENAKGKMCFSILLLVFAVVQMVSGIVCNDSVVTLIKVMGGGSSVKNELMMGGAIVTVVFALLNLGVQIASNVINKKDAVEEIA